jgi:transmembrane sensor
MKLSSDRQAAAADWFAKQRRVVMSIEERAEFDAWCADPENLIALNAMHELWGEMAALKGVRPALKVHMPRRRAIGAVAASVAVVVTGLVAFSVLQPFAFAQTERTAIGEQSTRTLPDGSVVNLNVVTRIDYKMEPNRRDVRLSEGQALFVVHKDKSRPFYVRAGDYEIRAVGTAFDVRLRDGQAQVSVQEGVVSVTAIKGDRAGKVIARLAAGQKLQLPAEAGAVASPTPVAIPIQSVAEWRLRTVSYEDASVSEVVEDLNRFFERPIEIADPILAQRRVTIRLQVADREDTLKTLSALLGAQVERHERAEVLQRTAS